MSATETRETRLSTINQSLKERGLKPLRKLGLAEMGEIEILGIQEIHDHSKRFFTDVKFAVKFPNGTEGAFTVRFNANGEVSDGAVLVVLVNGKFAIVKQWRLVLGQWTYEIPRGFGEKLDQARIKGALGTLKIADLPLGTLARELGEEVMRDAEITSVTHLGNIAENSGTHAVTPSYFLVQLEVDEKKLETRLKGSEDWLSVKLWDLKTARREIGRKLCDNHSITAVALATAYIESLPR
ncbi:MAG TPA: hypothetical protein V6D17_07860 [Candidatus Obscuribacterales bacterium]